MAAYALSAIIALAGGLSVSCASLQRDLLATSAGAEASDDIAALERKIAPLDLDPSPGAIESARDLVRALERKGIRDAAFEARLAAWSGRLYLVEGKRSEAERLSKRSISLLPGDDSGIALAARLERDGQKRLAALESSLSVDPGSGLLVLERARTLLELGLYRQAVAAFDAAFALLPGFYEVLWKDERNRAWTLRDVDSGSSSTVAAIAEKSAITWADAVELARGVGALPGELAAKRNASPRALFDGLVSSSWIPGPGAFPSAQSSARPPAPADSIDRARAAWFLWRLVADRERNPGLLTKYSSRYRSVSGSVSPVPDVPVDAPFFDAALGCVEREIMALTDGVHFSPSLPVGGAEFLRVLEKAR
jgi:tetratricopeptide (TPR) repeat protein